MEPAGPGAGGLLIVLKNGAVCLLQLSAETRASGLSGPYATHSGVCAAGFPALSAVQCRTAGPRPDLPGRDGGPTSGPLLLADRSLFTWTCGHGGVGCAQLASAGAVAVRRPPSLMPADCTHGGATAPGSPVGQKPEGDRRVALSTWPHSLSSASWCRTSQPCAGHTGC